MHKNLIKILMSLYCCIHIVHSSSLNTKLLEQEATSCFDRLQSDISSTESDIRKRLKFVYSKDNIDEKYKNPESFNALIIQTQQEIQRPVFLEFSEVCKSIYYKENNWIRKISTHMLLERVREKYIRVDNMQKCQEFKRKNILSNSNELDISKIDKNYRLPED